MASITTRTNPLNDDKEELKTCLYHTGDATVSPQLKEIAIVGSGISGLALAQLLNNSGLPVKITIFEKADEDRDEGYGLDFDSYGQELLKKAGLFDRYWEFTRPQSDVFKWFQADDDRPFLILYIPAFLKKWTPGYVCPQPESNRTKYRQIVKEALAQNPNITLSHRHKITDARKDDSGRAVLFEGNTVVGSFDLVVDCSGVHSVLRSKRIDDPAGRSFSKTMLIHGVINEADRVLPLSILERLGQGTFVTLAQGYIFCLQRFGAPDLSDQRTAFFYQVMRDNEDDLFREMGLDAKTARNAIIEDEESLGKIKAWIEADMSDVFDQAHIDAVGCLDRITISPQYQHGLESAIRPIDLPLLCIGDASLNIGLGGGGSMALRDVLEVFEPIRTWLIGNLADLSCFHAFEQQMMDRRRNFYKTDKERLAWILDRNTGYHPHDITRGSRAWAAAFGLAKIVSPFLYRILG